MTNFKQKRVRSEKRRRFISSLPCVVSGDIGNSQCAHIRYNLAGGMGLKPCDSLTVPLHWQLHDKQHKIGESVFWELYGGVKRAISLAESLYEHTGNRDKCLELIRNFRIGFSL